MLDLRRLTDRVSATTLAAVVGATLPTAMLPIQDAQAQLTRLPGVVDRPLRDYVPDLREEQTVQPTETTVPEELMPSDPDTVVANVTSINFDGNEVFSTETLNGIAAGYVGRELTKGDIARLKFDISRAYYNKGYVLVRVVTPPQDLSGGVLNVRIYEARLGSVVLENSALREGLAQHYADRVPVGEVFREKDVETSISDITELRGVQASMTLKPGQNVGETDAVVKVVEADEDIQRFSIDNYGSERTGEVVARLDLEKSNMLGLGETFGLGLRGSEENLRSIFASFDAPTGISNTKIELDALYSENEIVGDLEALNSSGESSSFGIAVSKAFTNTRAVKNTVRVGYENRKHESFIDDVPETEDHLRQAYLQFTTVRRSTNKLVSYLDARLVRGLSASPNDVDTDVPSRAGGDPEANIARLSAYVGWFPAPRHSVNFSFFGQDTSDLLLSSDLFAIGGYGSVRGFEPAQEVGDAGYQASLQYSYLFGPAGGWGVKTGVFYDIGHVTTEVPGETLDDTLESAGINVEVSSPSGSTRLIFDWASPLGDYLNPDVDDDSFYVRLNQEF